MTPKSRTTGERCIPGSVFPSKPYLAVPNPSPLLGGSSHDGRKCLTTMVIDGKSPKDVGLDWTPSKWPNSMAAVNGGDPVLTTYILGVILQLAEHG